MAVFIRDDLDQDQRSRIMVHQRNRCIHSGKEFIGSFATP